MIHNLSLENSLVSIWMNELRNIDVQQDSMRFRRNLERIGEVIAYEISKTIDYKPLTITTPLGEIESVEFENQPVLATILRAGLPMHNGLLNYFDKAENAFLAAYRKHHKDGSFDIKQEYVTSPDIDGKVLIIADPMLATGASLVLSVKSLLENYTPKKIHIVAAIAAQQGINKVRKELPQCEIWVGAIDEELTAKGYIVPGLGDAGDLCYGEKQQS